jgi:hypothetical protein
LNIGPGEDKFRRDDLQPIDEKTEWALLNGPKQVTRRIVK